MCSFPFIISIALATASAAFAGKPYSTWMADSAIALGLGNGLNSTGSPHIQYEHGFFQRALQQLYNTTGNATYYEYIKTGIDRIVDPSGTIGGDYVMAEYNIDSLRIGQSFIYLYERTRGSQYKTAADTYRVSLNSHPQTPEGQFWHKLRYPNQGWLDGIFMGDVFYTQYTAFYDSNNSTAWDHILKQFSLLQAHCLNSTSGLLHHGYDYSKTAVWANPVTGASPEVWDRALGWYSMALVDTLDYYPKSRPGHATLRGYFTSLAAALKRAVDPSSGLWWLVMSQPGRTGNYIESSGSAMFTFALLKGIRMGYLDRRTYFPTAETAYKALIESFVIQESDGTLGWTGTVSVGSLSGTGDFDYYISVPTAKNDLKGLAAFVLAANEYERAKRW